MISPGAFPMQQTAMPYPPIAFPGMADPMQATPFQIAQPGALPSPAQQWEEYKVLQRQQQLENQRFTLDQQLKNLEYAILKQQAAFPVQKRRPYFEAAMSGVALVGSGFLLFAKESPVMSMVLSCLGGIFALSALRNVEKTKLLAQNLMLNEKRAQDFRNDIQALAQPQIPAQGQPFP